MSNGEIKDRLSEGDRLLPAGDTDIEKKINAAMDKIIASPEDLEEDELDDLGEYDDSVQEYEQYDGDMEDEETSEYECSENETEDTEDENSEEDFGEEVYEESKADEPQPVRRKKKSARPGPVVYVPSDDIDDLPLQKSIKPKKKKHKGIWIFGLIILMIIALGGCAYGAVSYYFADRFFEGTWINGINCSQMTAYQVENLFKERFQSYSIEVLSRDLAPQSIAGDQISYQYLSTGEVLELLKQQKPYEWIRGLYEQKSYTVTENIGYNKTQLQEQLKALECAKTENQTAPENAYVAFQNDQFVIVPETKGNKLNLKAAYQILDEAVASGQTSIDFNNTPEAYVSAEVTQDDPALQSALEACNNYTKASITYTFGTQTVTLDGNTIKDWLQFDEKGQLIWDDNTFQQNVTNYVAQLAASYDTVGTSREFQTTSGRIVYVSSSVYGWKIDQTAEAAQLSQEIQSGVQTTREPIFSQTANSYGYNDLGDTYIEVDLSEQHMYYYQNGVDIFESDFVSGNMSYADRQTHAGIFTLYYKKSPDVLRGALKEDGTYEYEADVQYWMPFDGGIGFHDASWRYEFGGDIYLTDGSHGCINLPSGNAAILYDLIQYGVPIVCFY